MIRPLAIAAPVVIGFIWKRVLESDASRSALQLKVVDDRIAELQKEQERAAAAP